MKTDFTINTYTDLFEALLEKGFSFFGVHHYYLSGSGRFPELQQDNTKKTRSILIRQDVDLLPMNSLAIAQIQKEMGIRSTFYFRSVSASFNPGIIEMIASLGHEIGYHYEDVGLVAKRLDTAGLKGSKEKEIVQAAKENFELNLERMRKLVPVKSICMHGSPLSKWDSRLLWKYYDYRESEIEVEPYFDLDIENMLYLTDTGRRWNGKSLSIRDKAMSGQHQDSAPFENWKVKPVKGSLMYMTEKGFEYQNRFNFRSTHDIIRALRNGELQNIMMTFHPQRWSDRTVPWFREFAWQNTKNVAKYLLVKIRS